MFQNPTQPPFDDLEFRKAIQHAVDRKTIAEKIYYGLVEPSGIPAPASSWWYDKEADDMTAYNLDLAKQHLAKSRYPNGTEFDLDVSRGTLSAGCQGRRGVPAGRTGQAEHQGQPAHVVRSQIVQAHIMGGRLPVRAWRISCRPAKRPTS